MRRFGFGLQSLDDLLLLRRFVPPRQIEAIMILAVEGEEGAGYRQKMAKLVHLIRSIPTLHESTGVYYTLYLRYVGACGQVWVAERDVGDERYTQAGIPLGEGPQHQAYGLVSLNGSPPKWGYIDIPELMGQGFELDLEFEPTPAREITGRAAA